MRQTHEKNQLVISMANTSNTKMLDEMLKPVVRVNNSGSGLLIYSSKGITLVLTNAHVIDDVVDDDKKLDSTPFVDVDRFKYDDKGKLIGFFRVQSEIVAYDRASDLAMLRLRDTAKEESIALLPTKTEINKISVFDEVFIVGCALGDFPVPSKGLISSMNAEFDKKEYWMSSAPLVLGNSGGGCFKKNTKGNYVLVGVPTAVRALFEQPTEGPLPKDVEDLPLKSIYPHLNYMVPTYRMISFIEYVKDTLLEHVEDMLEPS